MKKLTLNIIASLPLGILACFFNFLSSLYSEIDISKIDLSRINRKKKKIKKIIYVIKHNYFLFIGNSILSMILNIGVSKIVFWQYSIQLYQELLITFSFVLLTEILVRYLADRAFSKRLILNSFFLNSAYSIIRAVAWPLGWIIKERSLSSYAEDDLIRLMNNLEAENVLEAKEARLIHSSFNFDENDISSCFKPRQKAIFLSLDMSFKEIQQVYFKYHFTRYPVLSEDKKLIGILNFKTLTLKMKNVFSFKSENNEWQNFIQKKIVYLAENTKLNVAFETLQKSRFHLAIVLSKKKQFVGIISLEDILETLVGDICDENEV